MRRVIAAVLALFVNGAVTTGIASPAQADIGDGRLGRIVNLQYGECLDQVGSQATDRTPIGHYPCDGSTRQLWWVEQVANGNYRLRSASSGMCVDVDRNGTASGTIMVQHHCNTLNQQRFFLISYNGGYAFQSIWVLNRTGMNRVIDTPPFSQDYRVRLWSYNASNAQLWTIE